MTLDMYPYTTQGIAAQEAPPNSTLDNTNNNTLDNTNNTLDPNNTLPTSTPPTCTLPTSTTTTTTTTNESFLYQLHGVVVHSGTAFVGHYYSYIRARDGQPGAGQWWCFDDGNVTPWDVGRLEADCFGGVVMVDMGEGAGGGGMQVCIVVVGGGVCACVSCCCSCANS